LSATQSKSAGEKHIEVKTSQVAFDFCITQKGYFTVDDGFTAEEILE